MKKLLISTIAILFSTASFSQCYYSFRDTMNSWQYWAFENGEFKIAEKLESTGHVLGWDYTLYVDKFQNFKYYKNGVANKIQDFPPAKYYATDNLMLWENLGGLLYVFKDGKTQQLGRWLNTTNTVSNQSFVFGDSVVAFTDNFGYFQIFYKGELKQVGNFTIQDLKASDNIVAYFTGNQLFEVFWHGETYTLEDGNPPMSFQVNRDIVAYVDYLGVFKVFWKGNTYDVASFQPTKYITGENFVVFISPLNEFKVFYEGEVTELLSYIPPKFEVIENILVYTDRAKFFNVFYKGKQETLEYFVPKNYKADNNILVWPNLDGYLYAYDNGVKKKIGSRVAKYYDVHNNTVFYWQNPSEVNIYCEGKNYNYQLF